MAVENKVSAGAAGAGAGLIVANFVLYVLATYLYHHPVDPNVVMFVNTAVGYGASFLAGWFARHTPRLEPAKPDVTE